MLSEAIVWCTTAWDGMPNSVIVNSWKKSGLLPDSFWEAEGIPRVEMLQTADSLVAEQYRATDEMLTEFREYFLGIMTAVEYAESLPREDFAIEKPPTAKEYAEQVLAAASRSSEEEEGKEEEKVTEEEYEKGLEWVNKYVEQNAASFTPKEQGNVLSLKLSWDRRKIDIELKRKRGQRTMRDFVI